MSGCHSHEVVEVHLIRHLGQAADIPLEVGIHIGAVVGFPIYLRDCIQLRHGALENPTVNFVQTAFLRLVHAVHELGGLCGIGNALIAVNLGVGQPK